MQRKKKKPTAPWRTGILDHHKRKEEVLFKIDSGGKKRFYVIKTCLYCKNEYYGRKDYNSKFCSTSCANKENAKTKREFPQRKTGSIVSCLQCGKEVYKQNWKIEKKTNCFCSKTCHLKYQSDNGNKLPKNFILAIDNRGKNNGMYKNGKYCRNGRPSKVTLRKKIAERDGGNWCLLTGKPGPGLHLHRVIYGSQGGQYEFDNCVLLSVEAHELVHSNKKKWQVILLDHLSGKSKIIKGIIPNQN